ncbi:putative uncharacterized protein [Firmicutes bacterium CAG:882]|nr:putative uncharacterized protein [Firmicutes bacterium CAG:882]
MGAYIKNIENSIRKSKFGDMLINLIGIALGSFIYACGISLFLDPNNLAPGGASGLAIIFNRITGLETGTLYFIINVPIMLLGLWKYGVRFIATTFFSILINSYFTNMLAGAGALTSDPLIATMAGSVLVGVGVAIVFKSRATTGGTDIIVKVLHDKYKHIKTGVIFLLTDIVIVAFSGFVFKDINIIMYALISVFVQGKVLDMVLYGGDEAKLFYIISDKPQAISERILKEIDITATFLQGKGAYTGKEKQVILCVARKQQGPAIEEIVKSEDKDAFMIISSANEIYGEGYKNIMSDKL